MEKARQEASGVRAYLLGGYYVLSGNMSLAVAAAGVLMIAVGALVLPGRHDVFAAMFGVWGATLVVIGVVARGILWANQVYARMEARGESA